MTKQQLLKTAKPILFNTDMVRAILDNRKTQTRRPIKPQPPSRAIFNTIYSCGTAEFKTIVQGDPLIDYAKFSKPKSRCKVGDILYVRETFQKKTDKDGHDICCSKGCPAGDDYPCALIPCIFGDREFLYFADEWHEQPSHGNDVSLYEDIKWRPSIHMPKEAARIFLRVTEVRAERLRDISGRDILAEGVDNGYSNPKMGARWENQQKFAFCGVWNSCYEKRNGGAYSWESNPWVEVYDFERVEERKIKHYSS